MALIQLNEEQIRSWSRAEKDAWWLRHVFRGDMPQLTLRSGLAGFVLGSVLSATALYISARTGIGIGVGLTSVLLAFALFRAMHQAGWCTDLTLLENNCTQSIATAAGYVTMPLTTSLAAYMLITDQIIPWWQMMVWMVVVALLGVLVAFPLKRRFINDEQLPFPEGAACAVVLDALYTGQARQGALQARLLGRAAALAAGVQLLVSPGWMQLLQIRLARLDLLLGWKTPWVLQERLDAYYYDWATRTQGWLPHIMGTDLRVLGLRIGLDMALVGVGGLMGLAVASSCLLGSFVNYAILAPWMIQIGDIAPRTAPDGSLIPLSRVEIINQWSLWWGVTLMVVGALMGLLMRPELFTRFWPAAPAMPARPLAETPPQPSSGPADPLASIELPLWLSWVGVPLLSLLAAWVTHAFFGVPWLLALGCLPLVFILTIICTQSMALTSWTPTGALAKITQFSAGALDRSNPASNLMPAGMTAEIASNAANLLSDIKPGYMLGGKPRHQAWGHVIGVFSGVLACVPLYFLLFLPPDAQGVRHPSTLISDQFAMPGALQWRGVADIIAHGLVGLPHSALWAMGLSALLAVGMEAARILSKGRFALSPVALGLGVVLPFEACLAMFLGALAFALAGRRHALPGSAGHCLWVQGREALCAGLIAGAALMGIGNAVLALGLG
jgi:uncharacterized oligopeptide transporter (OPT) family protein